MEWLFWACVERFKFWGMVMAAMVPPGLIAVPIGRHLAKLLGWHDELLIGSLFFAALAAELFAHDRFQRWRYFRKRLGKNLGSSSD